MRLHFRLSRNSQPCPFEYPHFLTGRVHKWIGDNSIHDGLSLYSMGWLQGGGYRGGALHFPQGATWAISAPDTAAGDVFLKTIATAALHDPLVCCGMEVVEIRSEPTPDFGPRRVFRAGSPVLVKVDAPGRNTPDHLTWEDPRADEALTKTLRHKLDAAGLGEHSATATVRFDRTYKGSKTKLIRIKNTENRASFCPVIVEGDPGAVQFAWCVGAGHGSGSGFGSLE